MQITSARIGLVLILGVQAALLAQTASAPRLYGEKPAATFPEGVPPPVITGKFTADPHAVVFGDTYYIYPTIDRDNWLTTEFNVWSSKDLIHWKDEGVILDLAGAATGRQDVSWAKVRAWAPAAIEHNGKYYFYFSGEQAIGVAVADKPTGPFKDALGKPLITRGQFQGTQSIDVFVMKDKDAAGKEQPYLYFGQGQLWVCKLKDDMISFDGTPQRITPTVPGSRFNEGIFVIKRKETYYFMWSENDARSPDYRIGYGTSKSLTGPITVPPTIDQRVILKKSGAVVGTGHHSVINVPGTDDWYMIYHRHAVPGGGGYIRETCLGKMEFAPDPGGGPDIIKPVDVTKPGFPEGSKGQPVPAK